MDSIVWYAIGGSWLLVGLFIAVAYLRGNRTVVTKPRNTVGSSLRRDGN